MKKLITLILCSLAILGQAQNNRLVVDRSDGTKTEIFMSGGNLAWDQFANDFGPGATNFDYFDEVFTAFENAGGNAMRLWVHINGANNPNFDGNGYCTGLEESHISDMQRVLDLAYNHNIVLVLSLWSFDMLNNRDYPIEVATQGEKILTVEENIQAYIDNALIPMVEAFKDHPAVGAWEIFNEPEGMSNEFGWSHTNHVPMSVIQRFVNRLTGAIHRTDPDAQVTNGTWAMYANSDVPTGNDTYKNYYSDAELIAAGGDADGTLDFYQVHYYDWMSTDISLIHHPADYWELDKPILVGEFFPLDAAGVAWQTYFDYFYSNGYAGALPWQWAGEDGSTEPYRSNMVALMESIRDYEGIVIEENRNRFPFISKIENGLFDINSDPVSNYVDLDDVASDPDGDPLTFSVENNTNPSLLSVTINASNQVGFTFASNATGSATIVIQAEDPEGLSASVEFGVVVRESGTGNLALFRTTVYTAHNEEGTSTADPLYATDGDYNTRWSSAYQDPAWYYIDLGAVYEVSQVILYWEVAYGQRYEIQVSNDATSWTTVYSENGSDGGTDDIIFDPVAAQYVRMYGIQRATEWGYSLYEFEVFGQGGINQTPNAVISVNPSGGNFPLTVAFDGSASSDPDGTISEYRWDFGDGNSALGTTATNTYSSPGNYTAELSVTDDEGATGTSSVLIIVSDPNDPNDPPVPVISANPISGTEPLEVSFNASGSDDPDGSIESYSWEFGDGASENGVQVGHTYSSAGAYTATLLVTDNEGASAQTSVVINVEPYIQNDCSNPTSINLPFQENGVGEYCYVTSGTINYVNSWNMTKVEINGVDFTNVWSNNMPPRENGNYYIYYEAEVGWAHMEIDGTGTSDPTFTLTTSVSGQGSVSPDGGDFLQGETVSLTALPAAGWEFVNWSGGASGTSVSISLLMDDDKTVTANFEEIPDPEQYQLTVIIDGGGSVVPNGGTYQAGSIAELTATADAGWQFAGWSGDVTGASTSTTVLMNANKTVTATFTQDPIYYTVSTTVVGCGTISPYPPGGLYESGTTISITATPCDGWEFIRWEGDVSGNSGTITITMDTDKNITAVFEEIVPTTYTVSIVIDGDGNVSLNPDLAEYNQGDQVTLTASGTNGASFDSWSGDLTGSENPVTITVTENLVITATFSGDVPPGCDNPVAISIPFTHNGAGEYCWVTTTEIAYINSWNLALLEINGVDFTNTWANNLPAAVDGQWEIHYIGNFGWSHFEAPAAKSNDENITRVNMELEVYPNPFASEISIDLNGHEASRIEIFNPLGQLIETISGDQIDPNDLSLQIDSPGNLFILRIYVEDAIFVKTIIRD